MTASPETLLKVLPKVQDFQSFTSLLLGEALGWPVPEDIEDPEDLTFEWSEDDLRTQGLDKYLRDGSVLQLQSLVPKQPWGIFIINFATPDVFGHGRGMTGVLRKVLRGLVSSARRQSNLPSWQREDLLFICTCGWKHYSFVHFTQPKEKGHVARLSTFGWSTDAARRARTVITYNLPYLAWPQEAVDHNAWRSAWSRAWDKEALTKQFYEVFAGNEKKNRLGVYQVLRDDLKKLNKLTDAISGEQSLLILNRLLFLYFIQKKGWLAQDTEFLRNGFKQFESRPKDTDFYRTNIKSNEYTTGFLSTLFARLSIEDHPDPRFQAVPFLNGGLFQPDDGDADLKISNGTFAVIFDELLDRFNFTVTEDTPLDVEVAIDPEMLGKIFECLALRQEQGQGPLAEAEGELDKKLTKQKLTGSYYTPRTIVHFMCQESLKEHLRTAWRGADAKAKENTIDKALSSLMEMPFLDPPTAKDRESIQKDLTPAIAATLRTSLETLRVVDPAVGSGAFVVGMLHEVVRLRGLLDLHLDGVAKVARDNYVHDLKKAVIEHTLFGVDIQEQAVRLCELRLWLSLVVDYQLPDEALANPKVMVRHIPTLPNLSYRIVRGDSLLEWLHGEVVPLFRSFLDAAMIRFFGEQKTKDTVRALAGAKQAYFQSHDLTEKHQLSASILDYKASLFERLLSAMVERAREARPKGQSFLADSETAAMKKERLAAESEVDRYEKALVRIKEARKHLGDHRSRTALPSTASLEELEAEIFGDTTEHPAFYWRFDFAEVFEQHDGFDIVIANPPFIRMELIKAVTPYLKKYYRSATGRADAYIYFIEQGVDLLRPIRKANASESSPGGVLTYISSSTYAKTSSGEKLRGILLDETTLRRFVDFGSDLEVFEGVTTYPAILVLRKEKPPERSEVKGTEINTLEPDALEIQLRVPGMIVRQSELEPDGWRFEDERLASLRQKIKDAGVPLREYCGSPLYGIKTGLNAAFVIDSATRDALVSQDMKSAKIIKPYLEGRDIKAWQADWRGLWLIYTPHGIEIDQYPAILEYLKTFKKRLEARATAHLHPWYELQQPQLEYTRVLEGNKILFPDITNIPRFVYTEDVFYVGTTIFFVPGDRFLQSVLSSWVLWWYFGKISPTIRGGYQRMKAQYMETLPIAQPSDTDRKKLSELAEALSEKDCPNRLTLEAELNDRVAHLYGLTAEEKKIVEGILPAAKDSGGDNENEGDNNDE